MKNFFINIAILALPYFLFSQTQTENYTIKTRFREDYATESNLSYLPQEYKREVVTYYDGLGRPKQVISINGGGKSGQDIVTPVLYDSFGRQSTQYLPYADANQLYESFDYRDNTQLVSTLTDFYLTKYSSELFSSTPNPYSRAKYDGSPLNRITKQGAPGMSWSVDLTGGLAGHPITYNYDTNFSSGIMIYTAEFSDPTDTDSPSLKACGFYTAGQLSKFVTKNENWNSFTSGTNNTVEEYKDKRGRLILKRTFNDGAHDTYYVYDKFSNLTYVIPPLASDQLIGEVVPWTPWGVNFPWTAISLVDQSLADAYGHAIEDYDNSDILNADLLSEYGGQGGFSVAVDSQGALSLNLNITTANPMELRLGELVDLTPYGNFADKEQGRIVGNGYEYYFLISKNKLVIDGYGKVPSLALNTTLSGTPLEYTRNFPWTSLTTVESDVAIRYDNDISHLDNSEILTTFTPNTYNGSGGVAISVDEDDSISLSLNISSDVELELLKGSVFTLNTKRKLQDMDLGSVSGANYSYKFSIRDNSLYITGSGKFNTLSFTTRRSPLTQYVVDESVVDGLCYIYHYDARNRMIEKKIPGKGWEYIVYDKLNRPVLTQDQNLYATGQWLFTKYDGLGRTVYTGIYNDVRNRGDIQDDLDGQLGATLSEKRLPTPFTKSGTTVHYSNDAFPSTGTELLTINYYDDYNFDRAGIPVYTSNVFYFQIKSGLKGYTTGSKIRTLGTLNWTTTVNYYDNKGRMIKQHSKNTYLKSEDVVDMDVDFIGNLWRKQSVHKKELADGTPLPDFTVYDEYSYDYADKLKYHYQSNSSQSILGANRIEVNYYNELGQLIKKDVGGKYGQAPLQTINYRYNIRGWLTAVNDPDASLPSGDNDLFAYKIGYNTKDLSTSQVLFNGNICETHWRSASDNKKRSYGYKYDYLNRLTQADYNKVYILPNSSTLEDYSEGPITYDKNGNIMSLVRYGLKSSGNTIAKIDALNYTYPLRSNRLEKVTDDPALPTDGFKDGNTSGIDYDYDANGNMVKDLNKNIGTATTNGITYNHLNLPQTVTFSTGGTITYEYDALGVKLLKKVVQPGGASTTTHYDNGFIYEQSGSLPQQLKFYSHAQGYVNVPALTAGAYNSNDFEYIYQYKDHLGNIRLSYRDANNDNFISSGEIVNENHYYPFGLEQKGYVNSLSTETAENYKYNGKELQEELELNIYDYGARNYDPVLARWFNVDPLSEQDYSFSVYNYVRNNPIKLIDPDGRKWVDPTEIDALKRSARDKIESLEKTQESDFNNLITMIYEGGDTGNTNKNLKELDKQIKKIVEAGIRIEGINRTLDAIQYLEEDSRKYDLVGSGSHGANSVYMRDGVININAPRYADAAHEIEHIYYQLVRWGNLNINEESGFLMPRNTLVEELSAYKVQWDWDPRSLPQSLNRDDINEKFLATVRLDNGEIAYPGIKLRYDAKQAALDKIKKENEKKNKN